MNIEEDIKKLKELNNLLKFFKTHGWIPNLSRNTNINETIEAIEHILAEREEDKKRMAELKKENERLKAKIDIENWQEKTVYESLKEKYIPKQKVMDKVEELEVKYKNAFDNCLKSNGLNMTLHIKAMCINAQIQVLNKLMEENKYVK